MSTDAAVTEVLRSDQRVFLRLDWDRYEQLLAIRGDVSAPRLTYVDGVVELMSPSSGHERIKTLIGRLLETWALHAEVEISAYGSWTLRDKTVDRGVEPDECYVIGAIGDEDPERPDLAIEVIWTHGGIDKLSVYAPLRIPEVWLWENGRLGVHVLEGDRYVARDRSALLPDVDVSHLATFLDRRNQTSARRDYLASLKERSGNR